MTPHVPLGHTRRSRTIAALYIAASLTLIVRLGFESYAWVEGAWAILVVSILATFVAALMFSETVGAIDQCLGSRRSSTESRSTP